MSGETELSSSDSLAPAAKRRPWPLLPVAPAIVALFGVLTALLVFLIQARQLQIASDEGAATRSRVAAAVLAAQFPHLAVARRASALHEASQHPGLSFALVTEAGDVLLGQRASALSHGSVTRFSSQGSGLDETEIGRVSFSSQTVTTNRDTVSVIAFAHAPLPAEGILGLSNAVAVLAMLFLGVAVIFSLLYTRSTRDDVDYVSRRIQELSDVGVGDVAIGGADKPSAVPLRSLDQVGVLTHELNELINRFVTAEQDYRSDIADAAAVHDERSRFLAGLSHELRTPLNAILGFAHLLESDDGEMSADGRESIAMICGSGEQLKDLVDDILDLSAMESGQLRLSRSAVPVVDVAREVARQVGATLDREKVQVRVVGDPTVRSWADRRRLWQILSNLVTNAAKATQRGHIQIETSLTGGNMVAISVTDTGFGIEPAHLRAIFEPYRQLEGARTRRGSVGLGLAITQRLVELHGGAISAESKIGQGTRFTFTVPDLSHSERVPRDSVVSFSESQDTQAAVRRAGRAARRSSRRGPNGES